MIQQTITLSSFTNPSNDATCSNDLLRISKRKFSFLASYDDETIKSTNNKRRKKSLCLAGNDATTMDIDCSIFQRTNLHGASFSSSDQDDIFDWMDNILNGSNNETSIAIPQTTSSTNKNDNSDVSDPDYICDDMDNWFLNITGSDPSYEEMISLLAKDDNNDNDEGNLFKRIKESFISDKFLQNNLISSKLFRSEVTSSKSSTYKAYTPSLTRRGRSSRIGIREGMAQLDRASRLTAKTRNMLLNCKINLIKNKNQ